MDNLHGCLDGCKYYLDSNCDHPRFGKLLSLLELPLADCPCFARSVGRPSGQCKPIEQLSQKPSAKRMRRKLKLGEYRNG